jgi:arsenate reductase-like glutaredoxin family protein
VRELDDAVIERNYAKEPLTSDELRTILKAAGRVEAVLNTRHATVKANGWKECAPSASAIAYIDAVRAEPNLIRRPILVKDGRAVVGNDADAIRCMLR